MSGAPASTHAARCELALEVLRRFGALRLCVSGTSMYPAIRPGDTLWLHVCDADSANAGDLLLFKRRDRLFVHRMVGRADAFVVTQGDALSEPDAPVDPVDVVGRVSRILRRGRIIRPPRSPSLAGRALVRWASVRERLARWKP